MPKKDHSTGYYKSKVLLILNQSGKKPVSYKDILNKLKVKKEDIQLFRTAIKELSDEGQIFERKKGFVLCARMNYFAGTIKRLSKTFGFAQRDDDQTEVFIPGKYLMGSMPGDKVLLNLIPSRTGSPEGEVISILEEATAQITGVLVMDSGHYYIIPDTMTKNPIRVSDDNCESCHPGDKVIAEIVYRGMRHSDHKAKIISGFGSAEKASSCAMAVLISSGIKPVFPPDVIKEAQKISFAGVHDYDFNNRLDLRDKIIFTIDSADSKDLDDAISIEKNNSGYLLGVHIADVSHYVKANSPLDKEALERGTSVYYANRVVPMLPKELSNGICSLNPEENRLAFSALISLNGDGEINSYEFKKSVIRSCVKGVYSEINSILNNTADDSIINKYRCTGSNIPLMNELADILIANRKRRGAPQLETTESKLYIDENDRCVGVAPRTRGKSEMIIEEFMLLANQCAANLARKKNIPFVYRIHEDPSPEKADTMKQFLTEMNVPYKPFSKPKPSTFADILVENKDNPKFPVINTILLRSMSKAKYSNEPIGHFGLALEDYAHFTSPIRRYPDLSIHRILTDLLSGYDQKWLSKRYSSFTLKSSEHSTATELNAANIERTCEDCYMAEYMLSHIGEEFPGIISSVTDFGLYVELENTVEGLVHVSTLGEPFSFDGMTSLRGDLSGKLYVLGDKVKIKCVNANVNTGNIDFELS
ncbi:MAG: ribonuclease R [Oscillospiraceae bacterium]|nr:ribonuclease R [Oscillospiraceae bacterium]